MGIPYFDLLESVDKDDIEAVAVNLERTNFPLYEICNCLGRALSAKTRNILLSKVVAEVDKKKLFFLAVERNELDTIIFLLGGRWLTIDREDAIQSALIAVRHQSLACLKYFVLQLSVDASCNNLHGVYLFAEFNNYSLESKYSEPYLFLIQQGALKNPKNAAAIELVIRKSAQFSLSNPDQSLQDFCQVIRDSINTYDETEITLGLKRLAILCGIILKDYILVDRFAKLHCPEELASIAHIQHTLLNTSISPKPSHTLRGKLLINSIPQRVCLSIVELLQDTVRCINILHGLESVLAKKYLLADIDISPYLNQTGHFVFFNLVWPIIDKAVTQPKTHHILNQLLLEYEREDGINLDDDAPVYFAGFVPETIAEKCIKNGNAFVEYNYNGDLTHGKYSHRLQWYIVKEAIKKGWIKTDGLSIKEIFCNSATIWTHLFDRYAGFIKDGPNEYAGFRSPAFLHSSILLLKDELPCLSGTLRKIFSRSVQTVSARQKQETPYVKICAEYDIREGAFNNIYDDIPCDKYFESKQIGRRVVYQGENSTAVFFRNRNAQRNDGIQLVSADRLGLK